MEGEKEEIGVEEEIRRGGERNWRGGRNRKEEEEINGRRRNQRKNREKSEEEIRKGRRNLKERKMKSEGKKEQIRGTGGVSE